MNLFTLYCIHLFLTFYMSSICGTLYMHNLLVYTLVVNIAIVWNSWNMLLWSDRSTLGMYNNDASLVVLEKAMQTRIW